MVKLGDKVKDSISGFTGIAVACHSYLQGCARISVQPSVTEKGELPNEKTFDEPQLEVVTKGKGKRKALRENPGGCEKYEDHGRMEGFKRE